MTRRAALIAFGYFVAVAAYVIVSDLVLDRAAHPADAAELGMIKGIAFSVVSSVALLGASTWVLRRLALARAERDDAQRALRLAERHVPPGVIAVSAAHDLNNIFTVLAMSAYELRAHAGDAQRDVLEDVGTAIERGTALVRRMTRACTGVSAAPERQDVMALVADELELLRLHPAAAGRTIELVSGAPVFAFVQAAAVHQIVTNLVVNALEASPPTGRVVVRVEPLSDAARIDVHDEGPGIPDDLAEVVFDPFFTTKEDGTGLGMPSVRAAALQHGGEVEVSRSRELGGARVGVLLRRAAPVDALSA